MKQSRRGILQQFFQALWAGAASSAGAGMVPGLRVDGLVAENCVPLRSVSRRGYRADASISFASLPIFSRKGVGGAFVVLREGSREERKVATIHFAGGSSPARTHGIEYYGSIEETVIEQSSVLAEAAYFGFVTTRPDESFEEARQRVLSNAPAPQAFVAVEAAHNAGRVRNRRASVVLDLHQPPVLIDLIRQVRARFFDQKADTRELSVDSGAVSSTFLYSVLCAIRSPQDRFSCAYIHNTHPFRLDCEKSPEHNSTVVAALKRISQGSGIILRLSGRIRDLENSRVSGFRLWLEEGPELPLRIEFQPRSYLRISLELDPAVEVPFRNKEDS